VDVIRRLPYGYSRLAPAGTGVEASRRLFSCSANLVHTQDCLESSKVEMSFAMTSDS
jgi:hypothetical protein